MKASVSVELHLHGVFGPLACTPAGAWEMATLRAWKSFALTVSMPLELPWLEVVPDMNSLASRLQMCAPSQA